MLESKINPNFPVLAQKTTKVAFNYIVTYFKKPKKFPNILATLMRKFAGKNFRKLPNLVTLFRTSLEWLESSWTTSGLSSGRSYFISAGRQLALPQPRVLRGRARPFEDLENDSGQDCRSSCHQSCWRRGRRGRSLWCRHHPEQTPKFDRQNRTVPSRRIRANPRCPVDRK